MAKHKSSTEFATSYEDSETRSIWTYDRLVGAGKAGLVSVEYIYKNLPDEKVKKQKKAK